MTNLENQRAVVTGGSSGIGRGIVEALVDRKAKVVVVARNLERLKQVELLGATTIAGDVTDLTVARTVLREVRPSVVILSAGRMPVMGRIHELSWEDFSAAWNHDTKAGLYWVQEALRLPLAPGSRFLISSSGAAVAGSPLSGGYAGAKRMLWMMAGYANRVSEELGLGIRFQTYLPLQMIGETPHGRAAAEAYARGRGLEVEAFLAGFGKPITPREIGEHLVTILTDPAHETKLAFGLKGDTGLTVLDA